MQYNFIRNLLDLKGVIIKKLDIRKILLKFILDYLLGNKLVLIVNQKQQKLKIIEFKLLKIFLFALKLLY